MRNRLQTEVNATAMEAGVYLPPELISEVLSRLPAKSIGRFRCVCKNWQSLLSDPQFLKIHFNLQNRRTTKAVLLYGSSLISIDFANNNGGPVAIFETLISKHFYHYHRYRIDGSCDGLLLLVDKENYELFIINPITSVSRKLPPVPVRHDYPFIKIYCGFGYNCSDDDDYAVVVILEYCRHTSRVYVLKRNCWKMAVKNPPFAYLSGSFCKYVNGAMHVFGYRIEDYSRTIYAFDLASEKFREVEQPEGLEEQQVYLLNALGGCLSLASLREMDARRTHDIWVMKEYGVSKSWTKYYTFTYDGFTLIFYKPLFLWGGDEFMVAVADGRVILSSLNKPQTISVVGGRRLLLVSDCIYWTFTQSLFSPNRNNVVDEPNEV